MRLASQVNQYLSDQAPWALVKTDRERAGTVLYVVAARGRQPEDDVHAVPAAHIAAACTSCSATRAIIAGPLEFREVHEEDGRTHQVLTGDYSAWVGRWEPSELAARAGRCRSRGRSSASSTSRSVEEELRRMRGDGVIDTHAHLGEDAAEVLARARRGGRHRGSSPSRRRSRARTTLSRSPTRRTGCTRRSASTRTRRAARKPADVDELRALLAHPKAVAVGETGLDYFRDYAPHDAQQRLFEAQLALARGARASRS